MLILFVVMMVHQIKQSVEHQQQQQLPDSNNVIMNMIKTGNSSNELITGRRRQQHHNYNNYHQHSWINENLIINFLKTYKHINLATLLLCPCTQYNADDAGGCGVVCDGTVLYTDGATSNATNVTQSSTKLLINISKHLMAASILIKASDIDLMLENVQAQEGDQVVYDTNKNKQEQWDDIISETSSRPIRTTTWGSSVWMLPSDILSNMLKSGDFKQSIVLDLNCRKSKFILQQVRIYNKIVLKFKRICQTRNCCDKVNIMKNME